MEQIQPPFQWSTAAAAFLPLARECVYVMCGGRAERDVGMEWRLWKKKKKAVELGGKREGFPPKNRMKKTRASGMEKLR